MNIRQRTARSGAIVMSGSLLIRILALFTSVVLARLLDPVDFGIFGIGSMVIGLFVLVSQTGIGTALIAEETDTIVPAAFHAFIMVLALSILSASILILLSPYIANFFADDNLVTIFRWMSGILIFQAIIVVPTALLTKEMLFGKRLIPTVCGKLVFIVVSIFLAFKGFGVWSLIYSTLASTMISFIIMVMISPTRNWLRYHRWDFHLAKRIGIFGFTNMNTSLVQYGYNHIDDLAVSKVLGTVSYGFYTKAYELSNLPVNYITKAVNAILLPAFTKVRSADHRLKQGFLSSFRVVAIISLPLAVGMIILADDLILIVLGEKWRGMIPIFRAFALLSLFRPLSGTTAPLFIALGFPGHNLKIALLQAFSICLLIPFSLSYGVTGVAVAVGLSFMIGFIYNISLVLYKLPVSIGGNEVFAQIWPTIFSTAAMATTVLGFEKIFSYTFLLKHNILNFLILVFIGIFSYFIFLLLLKRKFVFELIELFFSALGMKDKIYNKVPSFLENNSLFQKIFCSVTSNKKE